MNSEPDAADLGEIRGETARRNILEREARILDLQVRASCAEYEWESKLRNLDLELRKAGVFAFIWVDLESGDSEVYAHGYGDLGEGLKHSLEDFCDQSAGAPKTAVRLFPAVKSHMPGRLQVASIEAENVTLYYFIDQKDA